VSIGLSTYAFFWRHSDRVAAPFDLAGMLDATASLGVSTFQVCDYPAIEALSPAALADVAARASELGIALELGVRGIRGVDLARYLRLADALGASVVRSMLYTATDRPTLDEAAHELAGALPAFEDAGVTIALETYEQVSTTDLADLVARVGSASLGICLDVANVMARLENQREVIDRVGPLVKNLHVKDFQFVRAEGLVGFELVGAPLGDGLLDLDHLMETVRPFERGMSAIVEHWLPWQGDEESTIRAEEQWTAQSVAVLRQREQAHKSTG
jgi:sugar phosphate isomerase/epimerase